MRRLITSTIDFVQDCMRDLINERPPVGEPQPLHEQEPPIWWAWGCLALIGFVAALGIVTVVAQVWHAVSR